MSVDRLIENVIRKSGQQRTLFHFTDVRNLPGIRQHGLLSTNRLRERGIDVPAPGGNDWSHEADHRVGMDDYVHLCFFNEHPMEYHARNDGRIGRSIFLQINPSVMRTPGTLISLDVANKADVPCLPAEEQIGHLDLEVIYSRTDWRLPDVSARLKAARRYEILIPDCVRAEMILNIDG